MENIQDIFIIGGGINGVGIAADAAGRGLSVTLCEENDLASATSSASSKLIHGGLRYLEYYQFRLVREALQEREILLKKAPHLIQPLRFVMPCNSLQRPIWLLRLGFFLYDHLADRCRLKKSQLIALQQHAAGAPLKSNFKKGFAYSDCYVDDARLVIANALQAKQHGATILTRTQFVAAKRRKHFWEIEMDNLLTGEKIVSQAKVLINAAGPWAENILKSKLKLRPKTHSILVKGSHIVVPRIHAEPFAYILQNTDGRMIFVIPFLDHYSLIGTTDIPFSGNPREVKISLEEVNYLCEAVNRFFNQSITSQDVIWDYSGVRPLQDNSESKDPAAISRDYKIELNHESEQAPLLSIFGGKLTTYRRLAEAVLNQAKPFLANDAKPWTAHVPLPGGDFADADFENFYTHFKHTFPWLSDSLAKRYARNYGTIALSFLHGVKNLDDLGQHFGFELYQCELDYLIQQEWVEKAEDVLWRRTKLGVGIPEQNRLEFESLINNYISHMRVGIQSTHPR